MPTYVYRCTNCAHEFERTQKMSDDPITECESCDGTVTRLLFAPAIHFKGSGFHNTDYGTKRRPVGGDGDGGAGSTAGSGDGAAKPAKDGATATPAPASTGSSGKTVGLDSV